MSEQPGRGEPGGSHPRRRRHARPIAICVIRDVDRIFVSEGRDSHKQETFYRTLGGTIEFGERGEQTVRRGLLEEIRAEITSLRYLGTLENIFMLEGVPGHEIVLVYEGDFVDGSMYGRPVIVGQEGEKAIEAKWMPVADFRNGMSHLYPEGLLELLDRDP